MHSLRSLALFCCACSASVAQPPTTPPQSAPPVVTATATATPPPTTPPPTAPRASGCLAPLGSEITDARLQPKPVDPKELADVATSAADEATKQFDRGRIYFSSNHWVEAATQFRSLALEHSNDSSAIFAAQLYLESINVIGAHAHRDECFSDMERDVPEFQRLLCGHPNDNREQCELLDKVRFDLDRRGAERVSAEADKTNDKAMHAAAAARYLDLLKSRCLTGKGAERCDEVAYNAGVSFLAAGDAASAQAVRALMVDPKNKLSASPLTKKLVCRVDGPKSPACAP